MRRSLPVIMAISAACAGDGTSDGTDADGLPRLALVEELRIGSRDSPDTGFATINGVDVDRDGNVYALEGQQLEIRVYDTNGRLVRTIGRRGSGPGEFERAPRFWVLGDTVWVFEPRARAGRLTLFDRGGNVLGTATVATVGVPLQRPGSGGWVLPRWLRDDGVLVGEQTMFASHPMIDPWPHAPTDTVLTPRVVYDVSGAVGDTIGWDKRPPPRPAVPRRFATVGATQYWVRDPEAPEPQSVTLPDGRVIVHLPPVADGDASTLTVTRVRLDGDTAYHRRFGYEARPYDRAMLDSMAWRIVRIPSGAYPLVGGLPQFPPMPADSLAAFDAVRAEMRVPPHQPPVNEIAVQRDGSVWLRREDDGVSPARWLALDPRGEVIGEVSVRRNVRVAWNRGNVLWGIERDADDVPWLVRFRVRKQGTAGAD
jgi:hypothetical protein